MPGVRESDRRAERQDPTQPASAPAARTLSVVVPALNEEGNIQGAIDTIVHAAARAFDDYEVIVVNDGSSDRTLDVVEANMKRNPRIRVISHPSPFGFGASYDRGRKEARLEYCVMVHGDNPVDEDSLLNFFSHAGKADVVCGFIENPESRTLARRLISVLYTSVVNLLFGLHLRYYNGFQIHRTSWLREVELISTGFGFHAELLIRALRDGGTYCEVPYRHRERPGGGVTKIFKLKNLLSVLRTLASLRFDPKRTRVAEKAESPAC